MRTGLAWALLTVELKVVVVASLSVRNYLNSSFLMFYP
jgi:hypothetical protein